MFGSIVLKKFLMAASFFLGIFYFYRKGKTYGFNASEIIDTAIYPLSGSLVVYNLFFKAAGFRLSLTLLTFFLILSFLTRRQRWSYPKVADLASEAAAFALIFFPLPNVFLNFSFLAVFIILKRVGRLNLKSGLIFYSFFVVFSSLLLAFSNRRGLTLTADNVFLVALVFVILIRLKGGGYYFEMARVLPAEMPLEVEKLKGLLKLLKFSEPKEFIRRLEEKLRRKSKQLSEEEENLRSENFFAEFNEAETNAEEQDKASEATEKEKRKIIINENNSSKREVEEALRKMDRGEYGLCEKCGQPIDRARLDALPEARYCLKCVDLL